MIVMLARKNVRCPKCKKPVPIGIVNSKGKCNSCGHVMTAEKLMRFF